MADYICGKVPLTTKKRAISCAHRIAKKHSKGIGVYKCPRCKHYHLTSRKSTTLTRWIAND